MCLAKVEQTNMDKLFLLDAYAIIYRSYYAFINAPRINSKGMNTSTIMGFCNTLNEVLTKEKPTHIAVAFDHGKTFRHDAFPAYKAQRQETPEDIKLSIPIIKDILNAFHIPILQVDGFEADDIIGTIAHKADLEGMQTYMVTPDKDYAQLVTDNVFMYRPRHGGGYDTMGPKEVCEKYGISNTAQVIDLLGLMGDSSDNFPGCPGVGEKTAVKLIMQFGNIETLLSSTDQIKGKTQFAEYTGGHWTGSLTYLTPGEGYLFKKAKSGNINFVREFKLAQATSAPASSRAAANNGTDLWEIDDTPYADNMSMVAQVNSVTDASHCTLWAFVGDECRGKGVAVGDRQFITIHGVAGETVRFYVYDESSRLLHRVYGTQVLEEGRGTYNAPVMLYAGNSVNAIEGIEAPATGTQQMYDLQGRAVKEAGKGLYMVVKQTADGKRVVKKIKK